MASVVEEVQQRSEGSDELLDLLQHSFSSAVRILNVYRYFQLLTVAQFQQDSLWASLGSSIGFTFFIAIVFSLLRPYNSVVYAPKLKHADEAHAPPPMGKGVFAWFSPIIKTNEQELIRYMGLDATVFLRFIRMCRNIFLTLTVLGCGILIPVNLTKRVQFDSTPIIERLTPLNTFGRPNWAQVVCAYLFNTVIASFLWFNYRKVVQLRRQYYDSPEYLNSLHARTLMMNDIPKAFRTDEGIGRVIDDVVPTSSFSRTAIARNVKELPDRIAEHELTVRKLEKHLARYLKNPDQLPPARPVCKPSKKDPSFASYAKGQKVDAIEYLTGRIHELEMEIKDVRLGVDKRNAMSYGFASYEEIAEAHSIAYACRKKHPQGTTIVLAPRPNDVIWKNMPLSPKTRRWKRIVNNVWIAVLTLLWVGPNVMISIFLVNLSNLGRVWDGFQTSLSAHTTWWAIFQGVASPALTSLLYFFLPIIFRRMAIKAGDRTKTARERHVTGKLYTFFVFNNLIVVSIFSTLWGFVSGIIKQTGKGQDAWSAIQDADLARLLFISICNVSPFWVTYLLQRNLGSAIDISQMWPLLWSFCVRKFSSPTPRELIELTAPPAFDYATYYNYFLYYSTIGLTFATIQPLALPAVTLFFCIEVYLKKYLLLYVFVTKTESGGMFWRVLFNRLIFASIFANVIVFLVVWVQGEASHIQAFAVIPLPFLMIAFKIYCSKAFDKKIHYSTVYNPTKAPSASLPDRNPTRKSDRLASRFGHPALYRPLMTPMVHAKAQSILASIYRGRLSDSNTHDDQADLASVSGYSDTFALDPMKAGGAPGTTIKQQLIPGFEVVQESHLDFSYFKNRAEFGEEHGAGVLFQNTPNPYDRPGTADTYRYGAPSSLRSGSPAPSHRGAAPGPMQRNHAHADNNGTTYPAGYAQPPQFGSGGDVGMNRSYGGDRRSLSQTGLVGGAAEMAASSPYSAGAPMAGNGGNMPPGFLGGGPGGYGGLPQAEVESEEEVRRRMADPMDYDYFRSSARRQNSGWQGWTG